MPQNNTINLKNLLENYYTQTPIAAPAINMEPQGLYPQVGSVIDQFANKYITPASKFVEGLINPIDPSTGMPNVDLAGPVMVGKARAKNIAEIINKIKAANPKSAAEAAIEFAKLKYPKLSNLPSKLKEKAPGFYDVLSGTQAYFNPKSNEAVVFDRGSHKDLSEYIDSIVHELTHGFQYNKQKRIEELTTPERVMGFDEQGIPRMEEFGKYYQSAPPPSYMDTIKDAEMKKILNEHAFKMYESQPVEVEARKGGETGAKAWSALEDFVGLDTKPFDMNAPVTRENFKEIIQDAMMEDYKRNLASAKRLDAKAGNTFWFDQANKIFKNQLSQVAGHLTKGHRWALDPHFNPKYASDLGPLTINNILTPVLIKDFLKERGYTSIKHVRDEPEKLIKIEKIFNLPEPKY